MQRFDANVQRFHFNNANKSEPAKFPHQVSAQVTALAEKNSLPDYARETYGAGWRSNPVDNGSRPKFARPEEHHGYGHTGLHKQNTQSMPNLNRHGSTGTMDSVYVIDDEGFQSRRSQMQMAPTGSLRSKRTAFLIDGNEVEQDARLLPQIEGRIARGTEVHEGLHHGVELRFREQKRPKSMRSRLACLGKMFTGDPETTALPGEQRKQEQAPWSPPAPSKKELEMQRSMFFSTAKVPWIPSKNIARDDGLEMLVKVLVKAMAEVHEAAPNHNFTQKYNAHRDDYWYSHWSSTEKRDNEHGKAQSKCFRRRVLKALEQHPLCDIGELMACDPDTWTMISGRLGGLGHAHAVRCAMNMFQADSKVRPIDRAIFQAAASERQRPVERGRSLVF